MIALLFLFFSLWIGFLIEERSDILEKTFWTRLSFAVIIGCLFATWLTFGISFIAGFNIYAVYLSIIIMAVYTAYERARNGKNFLWFTTVVLRHRSVSAVHVLLLIFIMPFFIFGVWERKSGDIMYLGNYTDFSYHLSMVSAFADQVRFLPLDPQSAGSKMSYHFLVNFYSAILHKSGLDLFFSVIIPQILFSFALGTMLYYFFRLILKREGAIFFAAVLFIMGHIGFFNLFFAFLGHPTIVMKFDPHSWASIREQILFPFFNFLDPVINYFQPQRPFLFAFPLCLIVLSGIYRMFLKEKADFKNLILLATLVGLTPLFHIHTFFVLTPLLIISALCLRWGFQRTLLSLLPLLLAAGQLYLIMSQPKAPGFSGFDVHKQGGGLVDMNVLNSVFLTRTVFWIRVAGFPLLLGIAGFVFSLSKNRRFSLNELDGRKNIILALFLSIPFCFFLLINFYRFSPSWGDNNKFFLFLDLILCIFAGNLLCAWFDKNWLGKASTVIIIFIAALGPTALEAYGIFTRQGTLLFSGCDRTVAAWIKMNTPKEAVFLTSDDVIHYVPPLSGRIVVDGSYTWNTGFRKPGIENDVKTIYRTGSRGLVKKYNITHILVGPHESRKYAVNETALSQYELIYDQRCGGSNYRIYDARKRTIDVQEEIQWRKPVSPGAGGKAVFLSDIEPLLATQTFGVLHHDVNLNNTSLILNNKRYEKGLGTHANSEIVYQLKGRFTGFSSDVGLDDTQDNTPGSIFFKVYVDGALRWTSPVMRWDSETQHLNMDITKAQELKLVVEDAGDGDTCDHADWAAAKVF